MKFNFIFLIVMNILLFVFMGLDKYKAIHHQFRIPERVLLLLSILGGSIGGLLGMFIFHHKTNKMIFKLGYPLILLSHIVFFIYFYPK